MPCQYRIRADLNVLLIRHSGDVTAAEQRRALAEVTSEPDYDPCIQVLIDASGIETTDVELTNLLSRRDTHASDLAKIDRPTRWSYYAPNDLSYGLCRRVQIVFGEISNLEIGVFETVRETLDFLDLNTEELATWPLWDDEAG